jgi:hypothetical protein
MLQGRDRQDRASSWFPGRTTTLPHTPQPQPNSHSPVRAQSESRPDLVALGRFRDNKRTDSLLCCANTLAVAR